MIRAQWPLLLVAAIVVCGAVVDRAWCVALPRTHGAMR